MKPVHVGCSGWNYAAWRELFYPKGLPTNRWLEHYARHFETGGGDTTFYRLAQPAGAPRRGWGAPPPPRARPTRKRPPVGGRRCRRFSSRREGGAATTRT